jgi:hypothetical protein
MNISIESLAKYYREILSLLGKGAQGVIANLVGSKSTALIADMSYFTQKEEFLFSLESLKIKVPEIDNKTVENLIKESAFDEHFENKNDVDSMKDEDKETVLKGQREQGAVLKAMWSKMATGKGDRESYYGFPLLCGRNKAGSTIAPLFLFRIDIFFNPEKNEFKLSKIDDTPTINWNLLSALSETDEENAGLYEGLRKYLIEGISASNIKSFIDSLSHLLSCCHTLKYKPFEKIDNYSYGRDLCRQNSFDLSNTPIVINAKKTNLHLVQDLEAIANKKALLTGKSVAEDFLKEYEVGESTSDDNLNIPTTAFLDLCFPLVTNREQVEAAKCAEAAKITVVGGPPGTGKSHTIVNLITHLVSEGKSVLMTSQKSQALKVIKERLEKLSLEDMAMSMLKGDKSSKQELINKIKEINTKGLVSKIQIKEELEKLKQYRSKKKRDILLLEKAFNEARQSQNNGFQFAFDFEKIAVFDKISQMDEIPQGKESFVASSLREYKNIYSDSAFSINHLEEANNFLLASQSNYTLREVIQPIQSFANLAFETYKKRKLLETSPYWNFLWPAVCKENLAPVTITSIQHWIKQYSSELKAAFEELQKTEPLFEISACWTAASRMDFRTLDVLLSAIEQNNVHIQKALNSSGQKELIQKPISLNDILRIKQNISLLHDGIKSWWKWAFNKDVRTSRKVLGSVLNISIKRHHAKEVIDNCYLWCGHWESRFFIAAACREAAAFLNNNSYVVDEDETLAGLAIKNQSIRAHASLYRAIKILADILQSHSFGLKTIFLLTGMEKNEVSSFENYLSEFSDFLEKREALQEKTRELDKCQIFKKWIQDSVSVCFNETISSESVDSLSILIKVVDKYPEYIRFVEIKNGILSTLPETIRKIRINVDKKEIEELRWCDHAEKAVDAYRLHRILDLFEHENPENCQAITKKINVLYEQLKQSAVRYVQVALQYIAAETISDIGSSMQISNLQLHLRRNNIGTLRERINFKPILRVLPCWIMSIDDVARVFPLEEGLFDYVIIDEASQCNQATILHLLYRAKKIIIVGDEKQLGPAEVRFLKDTDISATMNKYGLSNTTIGAHFEPRNSLLQLANYFAHKKIGLKEHFRSVPEIIDWSNKRFYTPPGLKILTPDRGKYFVPPMEVRVIDGTEDLETRVNEAEANHIIELIRDMVNNKEYEELTIGAISPFRPQADYINLSLLETFGESTCKKYMLHADTADGFQGDERDIIVYSFRQASNSKHGAIIAIQSDHGRVNVMFTRARRKVIAVTSIPIDKFPEGGAGEISFKNYLHYCNDIAKMPRMKERFDDKFDSEFEEDVCKTLRQQPWIEDVRTQVPVPGSNYHIDLIIKDSEGRRLAVECDGKFHYDEYGEQIVDDIWRQLYIERTMGINFYRIPSTRWYRYKNEILKELEEALKDQETEAERLMVSSIVSFEEYETKEDGAGKEEHEEMWEDKEGSAQKGDEIITETPVQMTSATSQASLFDTKDFPPAPNDWKTWFNISHWGKETGKIDISSRIFAYTIGKKIKNGWEIYSNQKIKMEKLWKLVIKKGFQSKK